jgi:hypothetical protein
MALNQNQPVASNPITGQQPQNMQKQPVSNVQNQVVQENGKWYKKWWVWLIIVVGIILIGGLTWFFFSG